MGRRRQSTGLVIVILIGIVAMPVWVAGWVFAAWWIVERLL